MNIKSLFSGLGKGLAKVGLYVIKNVTDAQVDIAVGLVGVAAGKFIDNGQRREWAVKQLQTELKVPESLARWLVETAVLHIKAQALEAAEKAAKKAKELNK